MDYVSDTQSGALPNWRDICVGIDIECAQTATTEHRQMLEISALVTASGQPNYRGLKIPVPSNLNMTAWRDKLSSDYQDKVILDLLEFGFPAGYTSDVFPVTVPKNHPTATEFSEHVSDYINTEVNLRAMLGPFCNKPLSLCATSPLHTVEKKGSAKRRVVLDLSHPDYGSVNLGIPTDTYEGSSLDLHYNGIDQLIHRILSLGPGCHLYKVDLHRAYRQLRLCPRDYSLTGIFWDGSYYIDIAIPFGLRTGAMACQRMTNALAHIFEYYVCNYLDDLAGAERPEDAVAALRALIALLEDLGLQESSEKRCEPDTVMSFLGIAIDTISMTMHIPQEKIEEIRVLLDGCLHRTHLRVKELQSLLGKLHFASQCVRPGRLFVSRMLDTLRSATGKVVMVDSEFLKDVEWWRQAIEHANKCFLLDHVQLQQADAQLHLDACLTGCGAIHMDEYYHAVFPREVTEGKSIVHLEMLNIVVATRLWSHSWTGLKVEVYCDNEAGVWVLRSGRSRDTFLLDCAREISALMTRYDFSIIPVHIEGHKNTIADSLSRWDRLAVIDRTVQAALRHRRAKTISPDSFIVK